MLTNVRLLRRVEVERICGLSRSEIYRRLARNQFPVPVSIGGRAVRWHECEVVRWVNSHPRARTHSSNGIAPSPKGE